MSDLILLDKSNENFVDLWEKSVDSCMQSTFLHKRKFLSYHGDRFNDQSLILMSGNKVYGLFPAAQQPGNEKQITSHPGITYGGLLSTFKLRGEQLISAFDQICAHYREKGYETLLYKTVPSVFHRIVCQDDLYVLFRKGAQCVRRDLSAIIDLNNRAKPSKGHKWSVGKARKNDLVAVEGAEMAGEIWEVLANRLQEKYGTKPVHTLDELLDLYSRFPKEIEFRGLQHKGELVAGCVLFNSNSVCHTQYITSSGKGDELFALNLLLENAIADAQSSSYRYFDFGISNEDQGRYLNERLYSFKKHFGAGSMVHEFFEIDLLGE